MMQTAEAIVVVTLIILIGYVLTAAMKAQERRTQPTQEKPCKCHGCPHFIICEVNVSKRYDVMGFVKTKDTTDVDHTPKTQDL